MFDWLANLVRLGGVAVVAKLLPFIALPVVARLYTPGELGVINSVISLSLILAPVLSLRLSLAIPIVDENYEKLLGSLFSLISFSSLFAFLILLAFCLFSNLEWYYLSVPLFSFFIAAWEMNLLILGRKEKLGDVNKVLIVRELVETVLKIGLGMVFSGGVVGLFLAYFGYLSSQVLVLRREFFQRVGCFNFYFLAKKYSGILLYRFPSHFCMVFCVQFPVVYTTAFQSAEDIGMVSMAFFILGVPISIVSQTSGSLFYAKYSKEKRNGGGASIFYSTFVFLLLGSCFSYLVIRQLSDFFVRAFLGEEWLVVSLYLEIMSLYFSLQLLASPLVNLFTTHGKDYIYLIVNLLRIVVVLVVGWISLGVGVADFLYLYSQCMFLFYFFVLVLIFWVYWSDRRKVF